MKKINYIYRLVPRYVSLSKSIKVPAVSLLLITLMFALIDHEELCGQTGVINRDVGSERVQNVDLVEDGSDDDSDKSESTSTSSRQPYSKSILEGEVELLALERVVTIASKREEEVSSAPSIITVITDEEIENLGARTLTEIFRIVPGIDILKKATLGQNQIGSRGVRDAERKIKVLIDGHSINIPYDGGISLFFDDLPLKNVKRIEVIRGPGSALYGANAFVSVVNIITKDASDIDGLEVSSGFGSYDTQEYSVLFGKTLYDIDVTSFTNFYNTNGLSETIKEDAIFGSPIGLTPRDTDDSRNSFDTSMKLSYKDFTLTGKYMNKDTEPFVGSNFILTDDGENKFNYVMGELSYKFDIGEKITVKPRIYYDQYDIEFDAESFPDGFTIPFDTDDDGDIEVFPDGVFFEATTTNRRLGAEIQADYVFSDNNIFTVGFSYEWEKQASIDLNSNFNPLNSASIGSVQNVSNIGNWIRRAYRQVWSIYMQNKWDITDDLGLTIGVRHDQYSDFAGTTNPRLGLVWHFMENATLKLLYGQAFRSPAFNELYLINNPVLTGSTDLDPETIRTYEIGLGYKFTDYLSADVNYFFNVIRDEISSAEPSSSAGNVMAFENSGGSDIQGIEFELKADLDRFWSGAYAFANYSFLDAETKDNDPLPDVPKHKGNVGVNVGLGRYVNANIHAFISGKRARDKEDTRHKSPGYALLNFTLSAKNFFKNMNAKASISNLLDKKYDDPAPINTIQTDLPRPGRTFFIEFGYDF